MNDKKLLEKNWRFDRGFSAYYRYKCKNEQMDGQIFEKLVELDAKLGIKATKQKLQKLMQKIVLFIEPQEDKYDTPVKIGNLFMNRFGIDEDGSHEILKIYHLQNSFGDYKDGGLTKQEGPDRI